MSRFDAHAADFCGFACASASACQLASDAIDGDEARVRKASRDDVDEALDTLESCRRHGCTLHGDERAARAFLQSIVDTAEDAFETEEARHAAE
jgi:hypothetical protein